MISDQSNVLCFCSVSHVKTYVEQNYCVWMLFYVHGHIYHLNGQLRNDSYFLYKNRNHFL